MTFNPANSIGPFLPTSIYLPPDADQAILKLQAFLSEVALKVNTREISFYQTQETVTGQNWLFDPSTGISQQTFRKIFSFGTIAPAGTLSIAHNITDLSFITKIYGTALTTTPEFIPLPFVDFAAIGNQVSLTADYDFIYIEGGATSPSITNGYVVLEYLKT